MRNILIVVFGFLCLGLKAQEAIKEEVKFAAPDASPADIVYFPLNAHKSKDDNLSKPVIKVIYSRPQKKGREIFGVLEQYGKVWRFGANENTEIKFFEKVNIGDKKIKAGSYSLFAIPDKNKWVIIINSQTDKWGAFSYDQSKDIVRVEVPVQTLTKPIEYFSVTFIKTDKGANLVAAWDKVQIQLPISF
ncbi:DUF2911 domain-containing protein [Pedobacter punctiformis]|uniref:DUF2911 domain-containing protein n=1 Tax=Pedobacter punctiformis TaxID=3004097 RepID=A0ABT4L5S3_9SPHI|nr:DUF2911 domain-containing protein [Pedobacter sp. HCMS5-2]MCZ4243176.1 DUF2911 domain-containing protein [Pedobacter sp. HCMS5-2]